jgi:hypothetical protein
MGDLLAGLIVALIFLAMIPVIVFIILIGLFAAGVGIAIAIISMVLHLVFWAAPLLIVLGLIWLVFGGRRHEPARG